MAAAAAVDAGMEGCLPDAAEQVMEEQQVGAVGGEEAAEVEVDEEDWEEQMAFEPLEEGAAAHALPGFLKVRCPWFVFHIYIRLIS